MLLSLPRSGFAPVLVCMVVMGPGLAREARSQSAESQPANSQPANSQPAEISSAESAPGTSNPERVPTLTKTKHPLLWKIHRGRPAWIFGTIHHTDPRVHDLHEGVSDALDTADAVFTELPFDAQTLKPFLGVGELPSGQTLDSVLAEPLLLRLKAYLKRRKFPLFVFRRLNPMTMAGQLGGLEYTRRMWGKLAPMTLDQTIFLRAHQAEKVTGGIETSEAQMAALTALSLEDQCLVLDAALDAAEIAERRGGDLADEFIELYLSGDEDALYQETMASMKYPDLIKKFEDAYLTKRHPGMLAEIDRLMREAPDQSMFFAVGALHLPGENGILELLRGKGWKVVRTYPRMPKAKGPVQEPASRPTGG